MVLDIIFLIVLILGFLQGFKKGVLQTVFYIGSIFIGIIGVIKLAPGIRVFVANHFHLQSQFAYLIGLAVAFIVILFLIRYLSKVLEKLLKKIRINFVNQIAGGVLLALIGLLIYGSILWFLNEASVLPEDVKIASNSYNFVSSLPDFILTRIRELSPDLKRFIQSIGQTISNG